MVSIWLHSTSNVVVITVSLATTRTVNYVVATVEHVHEHIDARPVDKSAQSACTCL